MYKPILLEALVAYIARANIGIDAAMANLYQQSEESLIEFLYDDAWARLSASQKDIFFVTVSVTAQLNDASIGHACRLTEVQHSDFMRSLDETHFASMTDYGSRYEIDLVELAKRFFEKKLSLSSPDKKACIKDVALQVDSYIVHREEVQSAYIQDRVAVAFRNEYAKAAKVSVDKREFPEADDYFQIAIQEDPTNAALYDRYALFLLNKLKDLPRALQMSKKAVSLNPESCDANVTLAMVHYRQGDLGPGDRQIDVSQKLGRPYDFCFLQKGIARYHQTSRLSKPEEIVDHLNNAQSFLTKARKENSTDTGYGMKNLSDIVKYQEILRRKLFQLT